MAATNLCKLLTSLTLTEPPSSQPPPDHKPSLLNLSLTSNNRNNTTPLVASNEVLSVTHPSITHSNTLFFKSAYNVQVIVDEHEHEEKLIQRFRREVLKAGVIQESKRRQYFENAHDKAIRKSREAARRNRKFKRRPKYYDQEKQEDKKKRDENDGDNWEVPFEDVSAHDYMLHLSQTTNRWDNDERGRGTSYTLSDNSTLPLANSGSKRKGKLNK